MAGGRPTLYTEEMPNRAMETIGDAGKSITQFARDLRVSRQTIYQWAEDHPEFSDALNMAKEWSEAYWEDKMEEFMVSKEVNSPLVKLYMANRFNWHDSQKLEHSGQIEQPLVVVLDSEEDD